MGTDLTTQPNQKCCGKSTCSLMPQSPCSLLSMTLHSFHLVLLFALVFRSIYFPKSKIGLNVKPSFHRTPFGS